MKKILAITSILLMILFSSVQAMDLLDDDSMLDAVEGQAGITLTTHGGSISVIQTMTALSWGDDDGETTYGTPAAGHLGIWALTAGGAVSTLGATISLSGMDLDVDETGIFLGFTGLSVAANTPDRLRLTVDSGETGSAYVYSTATTLGDLWMDNAAVSISIPGKIQIAPH